MGCKVTMSLLNERQDGEIGDDWRYSVHARVFNDGIKGEGTIAVAKHSLPSGVTQETPDSVESAVMEAGDCGSSIMVRIEVDAAEVDFLFHDEGYSSTDVEMACPGEGSAAISEDVEVSVGVTESGGVGGDSAVLKLGIRLVAECD